MLRRKMRKKMITLKEVVRARDPKSHLKRS